MHANGCNILDIRHKSCAPKVSFVTITEPKLYLCCMLKFRHLLLWKSLSLIWPQLLQSSRELRIIGICMCYFMGTCLFQIGEKGRHCKHSIVTECHRWETTLSLQVMQNFSSYVMNCCDSQLDSYLSFAFHFLYRLVVVYTVLFYAPRPFTFVSVCLADVFSGWCSILCIAGIWMIQMMEYLKLWFPLQYSI